MAEPKLLQLFRAAVTRAVLPFENTDAYHPRYNATAVHIETKYCTYILHTATIHHNTHLLIPTLSLSRTQTTPCDSSCEKKHNPTHLQTTPHIHSQHIMFHYHHGRTLTTTYLLSCCSNYNHQDDDAASTIFAKGDPSLCPCIAKKHQIYAWISIPMNETLRTQTYTMIRSSGNNPSLIVSKLICLKFIALY